ncbi:MAG: NfeD family protein [Spirulinaceae cyanobacterium SM2_1_0]|nr:NfeD family protein [Spirulinaceae cyanobacterium SM2_1_0]
MVNATVLWLIAGVILCFMEFIFPTAFVEFTLGLSAIFVAIISLVIPQLSVQIVLWLLLSVLLVAASRRFLVPRRRSHLLLDDTRGETLTAIAPGRTGRVLYEGNSWQARCEDEEMDIPPQQPIYVLRREGNTLIVMPENLLRS